MKKRLLSSLSSIRGFTMIELLVVIAIIGVLAVAVLASINPIEQINKGRDTRLRSNAAQLLSAIERFYTINEIYPWNAAAVGGGDGTDDTTADLAYPIADDSTGLCGVQTVQNNNVVFCQIGGDGFGTITGDVPWVDGLAETDEIKDTFVTQLSRTSTSDGLYLIKPTDGEVSICFEPSSKQFQIEAVKGCVGTTEPDGKCVSTVTYADDTEYSAELICLP